jgi:hypothetical protein
MSGSPDYTTTPNLGLYRPNYDMDDGLWGTHLNANADVLDSAIGVLQSGTSGVINVLTHGAKGDGTTDDTTAIQAVLNTYAGKAVVFIPDTGSNYMVGALTVPSGTDLLIHGKLLFNQSGGSMIYVQNVSNVTVRGHGVLDGNGATSSGTQAIFYTSNATNVQLSGLTLQNSYDWNLNVVGSSNVHVDSVRLLNGRTSNEFAAGSSHCWITNSYITGVATDESFSFYSGCTNCGITNCEISYGYISGISVFADAPGGQSAACSDITISNNIVHHCGEAGIEVRTGSGGAANLHQNITITGNRCYSNATNSYFGEIWLQSGRNITVTGNALSNTGSLSSGAVGILVGSGASHITITGNSIWNIGQGSTLGAGIYLQNAPNVLIEGNHIYDNQGTPTMQSAFIGSAGANTAIIGNSYTGVPSGLGSGTGAAAMATDTLVASFTSGTWTVGAPRGSAVNSVISASNGFSATLGYNSNAGPRWRVGTDGITESGSNAGTNYTIARYSDANALLGTPFTISRATGVVTLAFAPTMTNLPANAASDAAAATAGVPIGGTYRNGSVLQVRVV